MTIKPLNSFKHKRMTFKQFIVKKQQAGARRARRVAKRKLLAAGKPVIQTWPEVRDELDELCSRIARRRDARRFGGRCLVCVAARALGFQVKPPRPITLGYHVIPRGIIIIRFYMKNIIGACSPCNWREKNWRNHPTGKLILRAIHAAILGEDVLKELEALKDQTADFSTADLVELRQIRKLDLEAVK